MNAEKDPVKWGEWVVISVVLFVTIGLLLYFFSLVRNPETGKWTAEMVLGVALVIGVIALVMALTFMAVIFKSLGLSNRDNSLGLPDGSVRAVIALSLILIFMISSVFLYYQVETGTVYSSKNITQEQIDALPQQDIVSIVQRGDGRYDVTLVAENQASIDIAKQIITTVSTLVVAVAGFYFGTKAVTSTSGGGQATSAPLIRRTDPAEGKQGEEIKEFKIYGKNFELAKDVTLVRNQMKRDCTDVKSNPTMISCILSILPDTEIGKWTVIVKNSDGGEDRLDEAFEVRPK
jgi:hypothetical protein